MKRTYSHLDLNERRRIARWRHAGLSIDIIAKKLGRHRSTIFREVRRKVYIAPTQGDDQGKLGAKPHALDSWTDEQDATAKTLASA